MRSTLGGLGVRSCLALLLGGVPVGGTSLHSRHGNVTVLCFAFVSPHTHRLHSRHVAYSVQKSGHGGPETAEQVLETLHQQHGLGLRELRSCLCCVGGDGAAVGGGPGRSSKRGTQAAEFIWFTVFPAPPQVADDGVLADLARPRVGGGRRQELQNEGWPRPGWEQDATRLHASTEWDKFHRQDMALVRAISGSNAASELYAVCKVMDHMFGFGDGRLLVRAAAEATNIKLRTGRMPGGTRKAVTLCGEPGHLLDNFKAYAAGLHLREAWRREEHTTFTQTVLVDAGRRLTALSFVSFALLFRDIMQKVMAPWTLLIQSSCIEPWVLQAKRREHIQTASEVTSMIHWCREFLRILVLLRQWAPVTDMRALTSAMFYARPSTLFTRPRAESCRSWACPSRFACFGRLLPGLMRGLNGLLHEQVGQHNAEIGGGLSATASFQGVPLATPILAASQICCGPHCQCSFLERGRNWVEVEWPGRRGRQRGQGQGGPGQAGRGRSQGRGSRRGPSGRPPKPGHVFAPTWVTKAPVGSVKPHSQDKCGQTLRYATPAPVRFHWRDPLPAGGDASAAVDRFRDRIRHAPGGKAFPFRDGMPGRHSRCQMPAHLPSAFQDLDNALAGAHSFLRRAMDEEEVLYGREGQNAGVARAMEAMSMCFDWSRLASQLPSGEDVRAFGDLVSLLMPYLRHTDWPNKAEFPKVVHGWPARGVMQRQYVLLLKRVRSARRHAPKVAQDWYILKGYRVEPMQTFSSVSLFVQKIWETRVRFWQLDALGARVGNALGARVGNALGAERSETTSPVQRALLQRIASIISSFVGHGIFGWPERQHRAPTRLSKPHQIEVSSKGLKQLGFPWRGRKRPDKLRRNVLSKWEYRRASPGSMGTLSLPGDVGKLVYVREILEELDGSAVSASIDATPYFSRDGPSHIADPQSAWHAAKVHNFCRPMGASEACCERVGSLMRHAWNKNPVRRTANLMDTVLLMDAGITCTGHSRDEAVCKEIRDAFMSLNRRTMVGNREKRARLQEGVVASRSLHYLREDECRRVAASGRWRGPEDDDQEPDEIDLEGMEHEAATSSCSGVALGSRFGNVGDVHQSSRDARAQIVPAMKLPPSAERVLQATTQGGGVAALPTHKQDPRATKKSRASSTSKANLQSWLESSEGKAWLDARQQRIAETA